MTVTAMRIDPKRSGFWVALLVGLLAAAPGYAAGGDDALFTFFQMDQNEVRLGAHKGYVWEAQGWVGTDFDKAFLKTEGEVGFGEGVEAAEVQVLYSRLISDFFDAQAGIRYDFEPDPSRAYAVVGLQGLAPQFFEVDAALFLSEKADVSARLEAEYELLITQRLVLQPLIEVNLSFQDVDELDLAAGPTDVEFGLRLRYEFFREFAPYIGVAYERDLFDTAEITRDHGGDVDALSFVAGIRLFF